ALGIGMVGGVLPGAFAGADPDMAVVVQGQGPDLLFLEMDFLPYAQGRIMGNPSRMGRPYVAVLVEQNAGDGGIDHAVGGPEKLPLGGPIRGFGRRVARDAGILQGHVDFVLVFMGGYARNVLSGKQGLPAPGDGGFLVFVKAVDGADPDAAPFDDQGGYAQLAEGRGSVAGNRSGFGFGFGPGGEGIGGLG